MVDANCEKSSWNNLIENSFESLFMSPPSCHHVQHGPRVLGGIWMCIVLGQMGTQVKTMIRDGGKPILAALKSNSQLIQKLNRDVEQIQFVSTIKSHKVIFSDWDF